MASGQEATQDADYVAPPEVQFDLCGRQILTPGFARYVLCDHGCGFYIGVGDAVDVASHGSCLAAFQRGEHRGMPPCTCGGRDGCDEEGVPGCAHCRRLDGEWPCPVEEVDDLIRARYVEMGFSAEEIEELEAFTMAEAERIKAARNDGEAAS